MKLSEAKLFEIRQLQVSLFKKRKIRNIPELITKVLRLYDRIRIIFKDEKLKKISPEKEISILEKVLHNLNNALTNKIQTIPSNEFKDLSGINAWANDTLSASLRNLFDLNKSDKGIGHEYFKIYQPILSLLLSQKKKIQIFEIGIGTNHLDIKSNMGLSGTPGASLRAFRDFNPNINVIGADIDERILFSEERIKTVYLDQEKPSSINLALNSTGECDLYIDDGLHNLESNTNSYLSFFNHAKIGSWIVIEDIVNGSNEIKVWELMAQLKSHRAHSYLVQSKKALVFVSKIIN
jgi:hypothetical protein